MSSPATDPIQLIADTTEEAEVRSRFAAHNARYIAVVFGFASIASVIAFLVFATRRVPVPQKMFSAGAMAMLAVATLVVCGFYIVRERKRTLPPRFARHFSDWILALFVLQFVILMFLGYRTPHSLMASGINFVWLLVLFRVPFDRRLITHLIFVVAVIFTLEVFTAEGGSIGFYAGLGAVHIVVLLLGAYNSRRVRTETEREWSIRREQAKEQLRMRAELRYARDVQLSMLPESPPSLTWLDVAATSLPASEVGGDYFDYLPVGEKLAIVSGDVAGHGLASGIVLSAVRAGFTLLRGDLGRPAAVLRRLHEVVAQASRRRLLTTASVLLFDRATQTATVANAGSPPIILRRADGTVVSLDLFAPPLGVRLPIHVAERKVPFGPGDVFVVHSDGVYEARNRAGDSYGLDALEAVVAQVNGESSAEEIRDAIIRDVERFRDGAAQEDDITVVVAKVR